MIKKILEKIKNLWDRFAAWLFSWQNEVIFNTYFMFSNTIYMYATNAYWFRV